MRADWQTCPVPEPVPCTALSLSASASWDASAWLRSLVLGADGALLWCLAEKPYPNAAMSDTWTGPDQTDPKAHDMYVSGGRWGMFYYDGSAMGKPKPIVFATRFLARHLVRVGDGVWANASSHSFSVVPTSSSPTGLSAGYIFRGPGCYFAAGSPPRSSLLNMSGAAPALVMLSWDPATATDIHIMSTRDGNVTIDFAAVDLILPNSVQQRIRVMGIHGGWSRENALATSNKRDDLRIMLLAGETVLLSRANTTSLL